MASEALGEEGIMVDFGHVLYDGIHRQTDCGWHLYDNDGHQRGLFMANIAKMVRPALDIRPMDTAFEGS